MWKLRDTTATIGSSRGQIDRNPAALVISNWNHIVEFLKQIATVQAVANRQPFSLRLLDLRLDNAGTDGGQRGTQLLVHGFVVIGADDGAA